MYKIKHAVRRGTALSGVAVLLTSLGMSAFSSAIVSADALNPLTERSLSLSSSSPGWAYTDGSGNTTYAGPNTGTNGQKTGNIFSFRTSSDSQTIKAFTFQYCTTPAGLCQAPGNDTGSVLSGGTRGADSVADQTSDLAIHTSSPAEVDGADYAALSSDGTATGDNSTHTGSGTASDYGQVKQVPDGQDTVSPYHYDNPADPNGIAGNFVVLTGNSATGFVNTYSGGWTMTATNQEESTTAQTGKPNMITLTNSTGVTINADDYVKIMFFGTDANYITNPGEGAFFVKINDYSNDAYQNWEDGVPLAGNDCSTGGTTYVGVGTGTVPCKADLVDGGVTVANVMNQSIEIQTKVLETMDFSVGTVDPDTLNDTQLAATTLGAAQHGECDPVQTAMTASATPNVLTLGNTDAENSLQTSHTYATHSYWRLSSNSSGGATVYYAGNTLSNTEGDHIAAIGTTAEAPQIGTEQFGLALDNGASAPYAVDYNWAHADPSSSVAYETGADTSAMTGVDSSFTSDTSHYGAAVHNPKLAPLLPMDGSGGSMGSTNYSGGTGGINSLSIPGSPPTTVETIGSSYAFDPNSQTVPTPIATESASVVDCVTGKMRYVANIAATTPAGIYTTKINYIAAPQY